MNINLSKEKLERMVAFLLNKANRHDTNNDDHVLGCPDGEDVEGAERFVKPCTMPNSDEARLAECNACWMAWMEKHI